MKKQYYYIITSLPSLSLSGELPIRKDDFLANCEKYLKKTDFSILESISLFDVEKDEVPFDIVRRFFGWERGVRNALVRLRAEKLGLKPDEFVRGEIVDHSQTLLAEEAFNADSPLIAEEILNRARWRHLDEMEFGHYFDIERLVVFLLNFRYLREYLLLMPKKAGKA